METLESSRVCRLCGKQSGISINIFDKNENHVKKINAVLPIMVHEMDLLPKHMCHRCSYKLEEFHKFYVDCLKTDADLKSQLSWMRKDESKEKIGVPMVHIENVKIKVEPPDYDIYELDPIVENVNYINSMSSVAFPVNRVQHTSSIHEGITYATYARCGCYCDKKDQSKQRAVTTVDYENAVLRRGKVDDADTHSDVNNLQAVKKNLLTHEAVQDSHRSCVDSMTRDAQRCKSTANTKLTTPTAIGIDNVVVDGAKVKSPRKREFLSKNTIVRNLRPRKSSVDYVGTKKKRMVVTPRSNSQNGSENAETNASTATDSKFEMPKIKVEKADDFEGRILRPRKRTIDYIGPKRKYSRSTDKSQSAIANDGYCPKKRKPRRFLNDKTLMATNFFTEDSKLKLAIKQELLSDLEDTVLDESVSLTSRGSKGHRKSTVDSRNDNDALPNNVLVNVQNDTMDYNASSGVQSRSNYHVANKLKSFTSMARDRLKSGKVGVTRFAPISYSPKYLRSQDIHLRNGKVKKFDGADRSVRKLRKNLRGISERGRTNGKNLMKAIKETVNGKRVPAAIKLIDNIKHYCEKCNVSFANKELYKLHACYD